MTKAAEVRIGELYGVRTRTVGKDQKIGARKNGNKMTFRPHDSNNMHQSKTEKILKPLKDYTFSTLRK